MKVLRIVGVIFGAAGLVLLASAAVTYNSTRGFVAASALATGTVVDLVLDSGGSGSVYFPVIRFAAANGEPVEFRSDFGSNPPSFGKGEQVQVRYDPAHPSHASVDSFSSLWFLTILFSGMGSVFACAGAAMLLVPVVSARRERRILESGNVIATELQSVQLDRFYRKGSRHPYRIFSQWLDPGTGKMRVFRSKPLWFNPEALIRGKEIQVRVDPDNPKRYVMDTSFLPESTE
ncbi:MAG: DUF3592 domain-containing protein [bacterium]